MVFRYMLALTSSVKVLLATVLYVVFIWKVISILLTKFYTIKSLFTKVFAKNSYDMDPDITSNLNMNFILQISSLLLASDLLSTSILQTAQNGLQSITKYLALLITVFNNITYLFKFALTISILVVLIKNLIFNRKNGEISKMFFSIFWISLVISILVLHLLDPVNDYILGHWK